MYLQSFGVGIPIYRNEPICDRLESSERAVGPRTMMQSATGRRFAFAVVSAARPTYKFADEGGASS